MMKSLLLLSLIALGLGSCAPSQNGLAPLSSVRTGAVKEGTLANSKLIADASSAIHKIVGPGGKQKTITKFVIQQPVGAKGSQAWREMWVYDIQGANRSFVMTFKEDSRGGAGFEIMEMRNR